MVGFRRFKVAVSQVDRDMSHRVSSFLLSGAQPKTQPELRANLEFAAIQSSEGRP